MWKKRPRLNRRPLDLYLDDKAAYINTQKPRLKTKMARLAGKVIEFVHRTAKADLLWLFLLDGLLLERLYLTHKPDPFKN